MSLNERKLKILQAIIGDFVRTAEPVGSRTLPKKYDLSYCRYVSIMSPNDTIKLLEYWKDIELPVRLIITDFDYNDLVFISKFTVEERAGEIGDKYINISFRKFREAKIKIYQMKSNDASLTTITLLRATVI